MLRVLYELANDALLGEEKYQRARFKMCLKICFRISEYSETKTIKNTFFITVSIDSILKPNYVFDKILELISKLISHDRNFYAYRLLI